MLLEKTHCERTVVQHEFSVKQRRMYYPVFTNAKQRHTITSGKILMELVQATEEMLSRYVVENFACCHVKCE